MNYVENIWNKKNQLNVCEMSVWNLRNIFGGILEGIPENWNYDSGKGHFD